MDKIISHFPDLVFVPKLCNVEATEISFLIFDKYDNSKEMVLIFERSTDF